MTIATILSVLLGFSAVCYLLLGLRVVGGIREIGSRPLGLTFLVVGIWVIGGAIELIAADELIFSIGRMGHWIGTALIPVMLFLCFRQYTGSETRTVAVIALLVIPVISIVIAATNSWHHLMWSGPAMNAAGEFLTRPTAWGPWYLFAHAPYGYVVVLLGVMTLMLHATAVPPAHRRGLFMLAGAAIVPIIGCVAYDIGIGPGTIAPVPLVLAAMLPIYAWLIIGEQIVEFSPLAYETVFQNMQDPVIVVDDKQRIISLNHGAEKLLNIKEQDALHESLDAVFGEAVPEVHEALDTGRPQKLLTDTGRFLHVQATPIATNNTAARTGRVLMFRDVSDVERAQREVQSSELLLRTLIDHSVNGILRLRPTVDESGEETFQCIFANNAAGGYLGKTTEELIGCTAEELMTLASSGMDKVDVAELVNQFKRSAKKGDAIDTDARVQGSGRGQWLRIIAEPVGEDVAVTLVDITDRKAKEHRMESMASSDPLTGVLNRRGFERDATKRLANSEDEATGALLFIDLNEFKQINDEHGHEFGDQLLTIAAQRLKTSLRSCDIIGRPGGDEFVALVPDVEAEVAEKLAVRLTSALEEPYLIGPHTLQCAASIGLALYPDNANTLTGLMRAADQAMYRAKARCRGAAEISNDDLLEKAV